MEPTIEQRISPWVDAFNMRLIPLETRPDNPTGDDVYVIKDVFTTRNGSWEPSNEPGAVPQWARDAYLKPEFLEAGANHHLFAAVLVSEGNFIKNQPVVYWSDGFDKLGDPSYDGYVTERTKESSGWANMFIGGGSSFVPERGESGPWCWGPEGAAEIVCGGGLPANQQISTFVVWQKMTRAEYEERQGVAGGGQPDQPDLARLLGGQPLVPASFEQQRGDVVEARVGRRVLDPDDLAQPVAKQRVARSDRARIRRLRQHDARAALLRAFAQVLHHIAHRRILDTAGRRGKPAR